MGKTIYSKGHKALVARLIKARKEAKLRQEDAAELLGRTQSCISKIEAGQRRSDIIQIKEFAKIYKKPVSFFIEYLSISENVRKLRREMDRNSLLKFGQTYFRSTSSINQAYFMKRFVKH